MSRGGRGGFGGAARDKYPFDIDPNLEKDLQSYGNDGGIKDKNENNSSSLFPAYPGGVPRAPPLTKHEKRRVGVQRQIFAAKHADRFAYFGPEGTLEREFGKEGKKRSAAADFDAFASQQTYAKKFQKDEFKLPTDETFKTYPYAAPHLMPPVLHETMGYDPNKAADPNAPARKALALPLKTVDKLARFDENAEAGTADAEEANEEPKGDGEDGEDGEPQDDDFEEDEDEGDDYNAENYFDNGDEDFEEGGDEGYDDGY